MTHHPPPHPVERVCICQPAPEHSSACDEAYRVLFFGAWRGLRARLGWPDEESEAA